MSVEISVDSLTIWLQSSVLVFPLLVVGEGFLAYLSLVVLRCWMRFVSFLSCALVVGVQPPTLIFCRSEPMLVMTDDGCLLNGDARCCGR